ncbi:alkaline phosphatase-like protein [Thelephora ganbajun]|uniref:Alkaline phosphatase-like protein n=1 Tax=Thelephora ganbajun TaxID=370292 RepID=A0ACB6ZVW8_THEGA|nr:alkaline phosphatase-like protein [Thelephora ganbajun]
MRSLIVLVWVFVIHAIGLYLFTRGFLLTRLSLSQINTHDEPLTPTHKRAVILIIDALRFDFISPDPPRPRSPHHHGVLKLPAQLTKIQPRHSFIFNSFSDPPTTTLQRIKGITTGSLPTFVDIGSSFGGSAVDEDSIMNQLRLSGKRIAFMGDDTWMTVFPTSFEHDKTFPYDSFNVEDLHTVDEGVARHLFPLLEEDVKSWDVIIGHGLGVDHVGHRVGPDTQTMTAKLEQMNDILTRIVDRLDQDTLLVVLGDHGMDTRGDHGGDGELETSPGIWIYSKGVPLAGKAFSEIPASLQPTAIFPGAPVAHRHIQQIDIVPTLSLLLGLRIPFNNLGAVIPELFSRGEEYQKALRTNAAQVKRYLDAYRSSSAGSELDGVWSKLTELWSAPASLTGSDEELVALHNYVRFALGACRSLWAQFNITLMVLGLITLLFGLVASWVLFDRVGKINHDIESWSTKIFIRNAKAAVHIAILGFPLGLFTRAAYLDGVLFGLAVGASFHLIRHLKPTLSWKLLQSFPLLLILHALAFSSNSFTFWEDHLLTFFLGSSMVPSVVVGFTAPTSRLRYRVIGFSGLFVICTRLIGSSTVCREEQQPYCNVTFFSSSSLPTPPFLVAILALPASLGIPSIIRRFLSVSASFNGISKVVSRGVLRPALTLGAACWILEWMESTEVWGPSWSSTFRTARTIMGWASALLLLVVGPLLWYAVPASLHVTSEQGTGTMDKVTVLGFANAYGAPYLTFWSLFFGLLYLITQLTGQIVLATTIVALLAYLEVVDSIRDVHGIARAFDISNPSAVLGVDTMGIHSQGVKFAEIIPLALLGLHVFYGTGHQSTISSIQWKAAFLLTSALRYPISPALVILNTFGSQFLLALASPLLATWNVSPTTSKVTNGPNSGIVVKRNALRAALGMMMYFEVLLIGSATSAAWLRRHLMVWKVFAPRFMAAAAGSLVVDLAVIFGVGVGVRRIEPWISNMLKDRS